MLGPSGISWIRTGAKETVFSKKKKIEWFLTPTNFTGVSDYSALMRIRLLWFQHLTLITQIRLMTIFVSWYHIYVYMYVCLQSCVQFFVIKIVSLNRMSIKVNCGRKPTRHPQLSDEWLKYLVLIFKKVLCGNKPSCLDFLTVSKVATCFLTPSSMPLCMRHLCSVCIQ